MDKIEQCLRAIVGEFRGVIMDCYGWCLIHPYMTAVLGLLVLVYGIVLVNKSGFFYGDNRLSDKYAPVRFIGGTIICILIPVLLIVFWAQGVVR